MNKTNKDGSAQRPQEIAGKLTSDHWAKFKVDLIPGDSKSPWDYAYNDYYRQRLDLRYLNPIKAIQVGGSSRGEGFSIVTIQCALIEFLAAAHDGLAYRHKNPRAPYEYSRSGEIFARFLQSVRPFSGIFDQGSAQDFYTSVRCGLLHEATTKNGWRIRANGGKAIYAASKLVYRNQLQKLLLNYIDGYRDDLCQNEERQAAFLRKFDSLASDAI